MLNDTPYKRKGEAGFTFGTKAETLLRLKPLLRSASIPDLLHFSTQDWNVRREAILNAVQDRFGGRLLVIRSSALIEDGAVNSHAGAFLSKLDIPGDARENLADSIDSVFRSMPGHPRDQVLIQPMASGVTVSGVMMTYDLVHGAPYYCIEYEDETGETDVVTSGKGIHKGLFVYRHIDPALVKSPRIAAFLALARELEAICDNSALDIEFGMDSGNRLILFQVRRISLASRWHPVTEIRVKRQLGHVERFVKDRSRRRDGILGARTILGLMPDWNPAEIIGATPRPLAASLYRVLITSDTWRRARATLGYRNVPNPELMVQIAGHPYIDVRLSFNSFLPAALPDAIGERLVNAWLDRLETRPEFHDKVEFEIVPTCIDFCFDEDFSSRYPGLLTDAEFRGYRNALLDLTRYCIEGSALAQALDTAATLHSIPSPAYQDGDAWLSRAAFLLDQCREYGAGPFAIAARHAFIAESLLRTAVRRGAMTEQRLSVLRRSIRTVTGEMVLAYTKACNDEFSRHNFLSEYGHLRPGTYEITSLRYDERDDLFDVESSPEEAFPSPLPFVLTEEEERKLNRLLESSALGIPHTSAFLDYVARAIAAREQIKFVFTRALSDALNALACWGKQCGLSRDDISFLTWQCLSDTLLAPTMDHADNHFLDLAEAGRRSLATAQAFRFGHLVFNAGNLYIAPLNRSTPNFVGSGKVTGSTIEITINSPASIRLKNRIVCIESADPGFDWIFTKQPAALITKFGGANSHMAIRCAELGLPAAIGCGTLFYERIISSRQIELDCSQRTLKCLGSA